MGRFYEYNHDRDQWTVCYLIQLAPDSPSAAWIPADMAWEEDLEKMPDTVAPSQENGKYYRYPSQSHRAIVTPSLRSPRGRYNTHYPHQKLGIQFFFPDQKIGHHFPLPFHQNHSPFLKHILIL